MTVTQLVYHSRHHATVAGRHHLDLLREVVAVSQRNNAARGITGFLIYDEPYFFQILEGERHVVLATYERIQADPRHTEVTLMALREAKRPSFPNWSMGGVLRTFEQKEIFLQNGIAGSLEPSRVLAPTVVALALDLQDYEVGRRNVLKAAS